MTLNKKYAALQAMQRRAQGALLCLTLSKMDRQDTPLGVRAALLPLLCGLLVWLVLQEGLGLPNSLISNAPKAAAFLGMIGLPLPFLALLLMGTALFVFLLLRAPRTHWQATLRLDALRADAHAF